MTGMAVGVPRCLFADIRRRASILCYAVHTVSDKTIATFAIFKPSIRVALSIFVAPGGVSVTFDKTVVMAVANVATCALARVATLAIHANGIDMANIRHGALVNIRT